MFRRPLGPLTWRTLIGPIHVARKHNWLEQHEAARPKIYKHSHSLSPQPNPLFFDSFLSDRFFTAREAS